MKIRLVQETVTSFIIMEKTKKAVFAYSDDKILEHGAVNSYFAVNEEFQVRVLTDPFNLWVGSLIGKTLKSLFAPIPVLLKF